MKFSAFSRFGHLSFTSRPSLPEQFYRAYVANVQGAFDMSQGTHAEATAFARAHAAARAGRTLERAGNQIDPLKATEILPNLEKDFGAIPGPYQDTPSRRRAVSALQKLPTGGTYTGMRAVLATLLGADFLALRLLTGSDIHNFTTGGRVRRAELTPKFCRTLDPITNTTGGSTSVTVQYENLDPTADEVRFVKGDVITTDPDNGAQIGVFSTITSVSAPGVTPRTFTAGFNTSHDEGAIVTTMSWPYGWSTRRFLLVVVTQGAAQSLEKRRVIDEAMAKMARGTAQWAIIQPAAVGGTTAGPATLPFVLGAVPLSATTFSLLP